MTSHSGKTALLLIDIQRGIIDAPEGLFQAQDVVARCADLLRRARAAAVPIFHVQHDGGAGDDLERLSPGWQIDDAVRPDASEPVTEKTACSAFISGTLDRQLRTGGITRLVIAGLQTDYCIDTNCRVAHTLGYEVVLAGDAHSTYGDGELTAAQIIAHHNRILGSSIVTLRPAAEIVF
jgi:nicotinamidase-related amidase